MDQVPTTILRPAIVVGDSPTGETQKFDGPYYILRMISAADSAGRRSPHSAARRLCSTSSRSTSSSTRSSPPASDPWPPGRPCTSSTPSRSAPASCSRRCRSSTRAAAAGTRSAVACRSVAAPAAVRAAARRHPAESIAYLNHPVIFDTRRALSILSPHGLRAPHFRDYVAAMVGFFREHEDDPQLTPS